MECAKPLPVVAVIPPRSHLDYHWDGQLYPTEERRQGCACFLKKLPRHGKYRARVCVYTQVRCDNKAPCPKPDSDQTIGRASGVGPPACSETTVTLPSAGAEIRLTLR